MMAIDDGPVAAPIVAPRTRNVMSEGPPRQRAQAGEDPGAGEADQVDGAVPPEVSQLADQRADHRERQRRPGDQPGEGVLRRPEVLGDGGDGDGEDRDGERDGQEAEEGDAQDDPAVPVTLGHLSPHPRAQQLRPRDDTDLRRAGGLDDQWGRGGLLPVVAVGHRPERTSVLDG